MSTTTYAFRELQLTVRESPSIPAEIGPIAGQSFRCSKDVADMARGLKALTTEVFAILHLDSSNTIQALQIVSIGTLGSSLVHPREVFRVAILQGSSGLIAIHNHPSGNTQPSTEDQRITTRLREAGKIIGITLHDHVIVGPDSHYSFADHGELT